MNQGVRTQGPSDMHNLSTKKSSYLSMRRVVVGGKKLMKLVSSRFFSLEIVSAPAHVLRTDLSLPLSALLKECGMHIWRMQWKDERQEGEPYL